MGTTTTLRRPAGAPYDALLVDARTFLGLQPSHNPYRWHLPVTPGISTGSGFLFGGSGLGAAIEAMEGTTGRPVVWATAQYLSYARPGTVMDIDVTVAVEGHQITQARAVGHVGNVEILTVNAALGVRPLEAGGQWAEMPKGLPAPDDCPARPLRLRGRRVDQHATRRSGRKAARLQRARRLFWGRAHRDVGAHARSARHVGRRARDPG